jgi:hypothetical protein
MELSQQQKGPFRRLIEMALPLTVAERFFAMSPWWGVYRLGEANLRTWDKASPQALAIKTPWLWIGTFTILGRVAKLTFIAEVSDVSVT